LQLLEPRPPAGRENCERSATGQRQIAPIGDACRPCGQESPGRQDRLRATTSHHAATCSPRHLASSYLDPAPSDPSAREVRHVHHPFAGSLCRLGSSSRADRIRFRPATRHPARLHRSLIEIARNIQHAPARFFTAARRRRYHTMRRDKAVMSSVLNLWNESRTNRARIADSAVVGIRSRPHLVAGPATATRSCKPCAAVPPPERANRLTREGRGLNSGDWRRTGSRAALVRPCHWVFAVALLACGTETNCVACMIPSPSGVGTETR